MNKNENCDEKNPQKGNHIAIKTSIKTLMHAF